MAAPIGAAAAIDAIFISTLVPVGAAELQGSQLAVRAPSSTTSTTTSTVAATPGVPAAERGGADDEGTTTTTVPSYLSSALPAATSARPVKVLLVGDSVAGALGVGLAQEAQPYHVQIVNEGTPGCSLSMQTQIKVLFYTVAPDAPCDVDNNPASLLQTWRKWVDAYNPDVVVYVARGETFDQEVGGQWQNIGELGFDSYLANRYRQATAVLVLRGASVVLLTSPYYDSGTSPAGTPWPEDAPARVTSNATMRQVASSTPSGSDGSRVYVFDLNALVSPGNKFSPTVDQINVRCNDGVHFTRSGGIYVGQRLAPDLATLGQAHADGVAGWRVGGLRHHRLRHGSRACPASSPACHEGGRHRHGRTVGADLPRRPGHLPHLPQPRRAGGWPPPFFGTQMRPTTSLSGAATRPRATAARPSGPRPASRSRRGSAGSSPCSVLPYVATNMRTTLRLLALMESKHPHEPHWYLATLGTAVEQQGKGVGSALMRPVLDHCDAEGIPCYLESSKERNVPFYRRHGFEVVEEVPLSGDGPMLWTMWREPVGPA